MKLVTTTILFLSLAIAAKTNADQTSSVSFSEARILAPINGTTVTAGYAMIKNDSDKPVSLLIKEVKPFKAAEVHETFQANGKTGMRKIAQITIPAHQSFELKPGGNHIMLFDPSRAISPGEDLTVSFLVDGKLTDEKFKVVLRSQPSPKEKH